MTIEIEKLSGGLALEKDLVLPGKPDDPEMRESVSVWLFEENGAFAMPRTGIEAEASSWEDRRLQANFAFANFSQYLHRFEKARAPRRITRATAATA